MSLIQQKIERLGKSTGAPDDWKKLVLYGRAHGKIIPHFDLVRVSEPGKISICGNGQIIQKINGGDILDWRSFTLSDGIQVPNFFMRFEVAPFRLIEGAMNCFDFWIPFEDDDVYEKLDALICELKRKKDFKWDLIE
jgi:hypothetical protein